MAQALQRAGLLYARFRHYRVRLGGVRGYVVVPCTIGEPDVGVAEWG